MLDENVVKLIREHYPEKEAEYCISAYAFADEMHKGVCRASGEPYIIHPVAVATILINLGLDENAVAAAFLHDVVEDTPTTSEDLKNKFGEETAMLVEGVTKLDKIAFHSKEEEQAENIRKIFVAMAHDIRVIIIKLADRLHNMRSLEFLSPERQKRMAKETLDIFCPLAGRLGISQIKCELDDLCLKYLHPEDYEQLSKDISQLFGESENLLQDTIEELRKILDESGVKGEVFGRQKHLYSIWKKMKAQNKKIDQIFDLAAVRVIVSTIDECYEIFGKIHKKWRPVPGRIKDYIATPKKNKYQSLHTTVVTNFGKPVEIQIRTTEMHRMAEYGIAAHWKYKEQITETDSFGDRLNWIREVMEWQGGFKDSKEFLESLKGDLYSGEILVFTPRGDVINLPKECTPIDFAYSIHSEVGNKCIGAKVNDKMVPLGTELKTGDVVEILTSASSKGPSWDWLKIVKNAGTKAKIKQFFKREMKDENIRLGKSMLEKEARKRGYEFSDLLTEEAFKLISPRMSFSGEDEMYASVGLGAVTTNQILFKLIDIYKREQPQNEEKSDVSVKRINADGVEVKGVTGLLIRFAGCCSPVPGDPILGFISRGRGVMIHRSDCQNVRNFKPERILPANWTAEDDANFFAALKIRAVDKTGILSDVITTVGSQNVAIMAVNARVDKKHFANIDLTVKLTSKKDLDTLISKLESNADVQEVYRTTT